MSANGSADGAHGPGPASEDPKGHLWTRLGLRARVTLMFGLGALVLSIVMGCVSYFTARHFLVDNRENSAKVTAFANASQVRNFAEFESHSGTKPETVLEGLDAGVASHSVLFYDNAWYSSIAKVGKNATPAAMRALVLSGTPATQNYWLGGSPQIAVGVPIPSVHAAYFEVFDVSDLARTLRVLALALTAAGVVTTLLGFSVGRSASGRSLRPLTDVSRAAMAIAGGDLDTRLPEVGDDPDLAGLTLSFNRMVDQLQERIERESRFTSDVSHELRSPLTTLSASLEVLERDRDQLSPQARQALDLLAADLRRFQRMVDELLEISRSDTGSVDLWMEEVAADDLVRHSVAASARSLARLGPPATSAVLVVDVDGVSGTRLRVDKRRFERIVANLLENAAFYGGGATRVSATLGPEHNGHATVRVAVDDHGPGLEPDERVKVFERFYRGHASGRRGTGMGTGLGLALVAEHARLNGGTVWAEEAPGGGARFVVELPVMSEAEQAEELEGSDSP
ncbi:MAG TPA: HAMP domain-containing sensor histidine kinase [Acidimicrobiales bacterium]|nr:HAMP domain-containing sensor histidine kinase [Acidimicrobiales bacterium]